MNKYPEIFTSSDGRQRSILINKNIHKKIFHLFNVYITGTAHIYDSVGATANNGKNSSLVVYGNHLFITVVFAK